MYSSSLSDHPVFNVTWDDTNTYCRWLSEKTGRKYRLPTEPEWEYAARGDLQYRYPWGNEWVSGKCNTQEERHGDTTSVGQYSLAGGDSPFGCADMAGNVWEWTSDWYQPYPESEANSFDFGQQYKVLRGGSWEQDKARARCTCREWRDWFAHRSNRVGFRCVRILEKDNQKGDI